MEEVLLVVMEAKTNMMMHPGAALAVLFSDFLSIRHTFLF
jgi:hypothetical protein